MVSKERMRQNYGIELIASENFASEDVRRLQGSILTNKYAEGYPGKRYYGGCVNIDGVEKLAQELACQLFDCEFANVQPHSGSQANQAVYMALLEPGDTILGMSLDAGGHLTHGYSLSSSGKLYNACFYGVDRHTEMIDYDAVLTIARECKPKLIIAGASAYSRIIDFKKFREIADEVGAILMVDMAHIAGLVAAEYHPSPFPHAHVVTTTTHKTLRGPRGGMILTNDEEIYKKVNRAVFPGIQGGPLMHVIAAKAQCFYEALQQDYKGYIWSVINNAKTMADMFIKLGYHVVSGGTDNHLLIVDTYSTLGVTGKDAEAALEKIGITVNKNTIPNDQLKPMVASGIRLGTPAITTRGLGAADCEAIAILIHHQLRNNPSLEATDELIQATLFEIISKMKGV